jgi:hypothetical protein
LDFCGCWETYEILRANWFGNPSTLWNRPCGLIALGLGVTLLLIIGAVVSMVGWNVLGLQPVGVIFLKDKFSLLCYYLHAYECISDVYLIIV